MRKQLAVISIAAAFAAVAAPSWAFQSVQIATVTAGTTTGGAKVAQFSLAIKDVSDPFGANNPGSIGWSGVDPLSTQWKIADQLLVINSTVTDLNGGIKIYTDNTAADASPQFVDPTPGNTVNQDSLASGLLLGTSGTTSEPPLAMAWSIKASTRVVEGGDVNTGIGAADPNNGPETATADNRFQWLFMTDEYNWDTGVDFNGDGDAVDEGDATAQALDSAFVTMINNVGIHFGQDDAEFGAHPNGEDAFVYFQANFSGAQVQQAYQTSTLRVEAFIE